MVDDVEASTSSSPGAALPVQLTVDIDGDGGVHSSRTDVDVESGSSSTLSDSSSHSFNPQVRQWIATDPSELSHISPIVASVHITLAVAYVSLLARGDNDTRIFSKLTNVCYVVASLGMNFTIKFGRAGDTGVDGSIHEVGLLVMGLVGATSLSFHTHLGVVKQVHRDPDYEDRRHAFDVLSVYILLIHLVHVHLSVCLSGLATSKTARGLIRAVLTVVFIGNVLIVILLYDELANGEQSTQKLLFYAASPVVAFAVWCRLRLASSQNARLRSIPFKVAMLEIGTILIVLVSAAFSNCELLGENYVYYKKPWNFGPDDNVKPQTFDYYHGNWHYLTSLIISLMYLRCADASRALQAPGSPILRHGVRHLHPGKVCWDDVVALGLILLYSLVLLASKELRWDLDATRKLLGGFNLLFLCHALFCVRRLRDSTRARLCEARETVMRALRV